MVNGVKNFREIKNRARREHLDELTERSQVTSQRLGRERGKAFTHSEFHYQIKLTHSVSNSKPLTQFSTFLYFALITIHNLDPSSINFILPFSKLYTQEANENRLMLFLESISIILS